LFFFQAEDGIRDRNVTGVQTCALPIWPSPTIYAVNLSSVRSDRQIFALPSIPASPFPIYSIIQNYVKSFSKTATKKPSVPVLWRSEERRVGKECGCGWGGDV